MSVLVCASFSIEYPSSGMCSVISNMLKLAKKLGKSPECVIIACKARFRSRRRSRSGGARVWPFLLEPELEPEWEFLEPAPAPKP